MKIVFIGSGNVGGALAGQLAKAGHDVVLAQARDSEAKKDGSSSIEAALKRSPQLRSAPLLESILPAEIVFLATPFPANQSILEPISDALAGKILVDCTNPVGPGLTHGLRSEKSGSEFVQSLVPKANVVKAFSIYGFENFANSSYPGYSVKPAMLFCGNDSNSKQTVAGLIADCGFEPVDVGHLNQALHLEHMTLLWVRMVRAEGNSPNLVWGALRR